MLAYRISGGELRGILDQIPDNRDYGSYGSLLAKYEREGRDGRLSVRSRLQDKFSDGDSAAAFLGQMQGVVYIDGVPLTHDGLRDAIADIFGRGETWGKYANRTMDSEIGRAHV